MALDLSKPADNTQFPLFPAYMRGVLAQLDAGYAIYPLVFTVAGNLVVGVNKSIEIPIIVDSTRPPTIVSCIARVKTAPTGQSAIFDVNKNGVTIFTTQANRPAIAAASQLSSEVAPDVTSLQALDIMTLDVDQIGSGTVGADLVLIVKIKQRIVIP